MALQLHVRQLDYLRDPLPVATLKHYTFEEGTQGAAPAVAGDYLALVGSVTYETTAANRGTLGLLSTNGGYLAVSSGATPMGFQVYFTPPGTTTGAPRLITLMDSANVFLGMFRPHTDGKFDIADSTSTRQAASTVSWVAGQRYRVEGTLTGTGTSRIMAVQVFEGDSTTSIWTSGNVTVTTTTSSPWARARIGGQGASAGVMWIDDVRFFDAPQFMGPLPATGTSIAPAGIASAEAVGAPSAVLSLTASPAGIATGAALGTPAASSTLLVSPGGISSGEAIGTPSVSAALSASPAGISTGAALGTPTASGALTVAPNGIGTAAALGTPSALSTLTVSPGGISTGEAVGAPTATTAGVVETGGIPSAAALGTPSASSVLEVSPAGIGSGAVVGVPSVDATLTVSPAGISSGEAIGSPAVGAVLGVSAGGIPSGEAVGIPTAVIVLTIEPAGIASAEALGSPTVLGGVPAVSRDLTLVGSLEDTRMSGTLVAGRWLGGIEPARLSGSIEPGSKSATLDPADLTGALTWP